MLSFHRIGGFPSTEASAIAGGEVYDIAITSYRFDDVVLRFVDERIEPVPAPDVPGVDCGSLAEYW